MKRNLARRVRVIVLTVLGIVLISSYAFCRGGKPSQNLTVNPGQEASNPNPEKDKETRIIIDTRLKLSKPLPLLPTKS